MAYTADKKVRDLEAYGKNHGFTQIVLVGIDRESGTMSGVSWGATAALCKKTQPLMDAAYDAVYHKLAQGEANV